VRASRHVDRLILPQVRQAHLRRPRIRSSRGTSAFCGRCRQPIAGHNIRGASPLNGTDNGPTHVNCHRGPPPPRLICGLVRPRNPDKRVKHVGPKTATRELQCGRRGAQAEVVPGRGLTNVHDMMLLVAASTSSYSWRFGSEFTRLSSRGVLGGPASEQPAP